jgi:hypothetical protein
MISSKVYFVIDFKWIFLIIVEAVLILEEIFLILTLRLLKCETFYCNFFYEVIFFNIPKTIFLMTLPLGQPSL